LVSAFLLLILSFLEHLHYCFASLLCFAPDRRHPRPSLAPPFRSRRSFFQQLQVGGSTLQTLQGTFAAMGVPEAASLMGIPMKHISLITVSLPQSAGMALAKIYKAHLPKFCSYSGQFDFQNASAVIS
jgi:hypothetical protein